MQIIHTIPELQQWSKEQHKNGKIVGLIPTMGFLHAGHLSLIDKAKMEGATAVAVSIFVNPTQFAPNEDLDKYPRDFAHDCELCESRGVDVIFAPASTDMYAPDRSTWVTEETVSRGLCAVTRPIHFRGVATVVAKLFNAALPDLAVFGQKDAQQAAVIKRMVRDLNFPVRIVVSELIRENDGLALSSRNKYLSADEHKRALVLSRSLEQAKQQVEHGSRNLIPALLEDIKRQIADAGGVTDYVEVRDADTMLALQPQSKAVTFAVAAYFGKTRLIDNKIAVLPN